MAAPIQNTYFIDPATLAQLQAQVAALQAYVNQYY